MAVKSLSRKIAELRIKARKRETASLAAENRRIRLAENKKARSQQRSEKYGPASKARAERAERNKQEVKKVVGAVGKTVGGLLSGLFKEPKKVRKPAKRKAVGSRKKTTRRAR